jgi:PAS domain S-box-containing protein
MEGAVSAASYVIEPPDLWSARSARRVAGAPVWESGGDAPGWLIGDFRCTVPAWQVHAVLTDAPTLVMTLTTGVALVATGAGMVAFEAVQAYRRTSRDLRSIAEMVGATSGAALAFNDPAAAQETLDALRSRPEIVCVGLYDAAGRPFAGYGYSGTAESLPTTPGSDRLAFHEDSLLLVAPVRLDGERTGTVYVRASLVSLAATLRGYGLSVLLMTLAAMALAVPIARRLQHSVSLPILQLAETAQAVTRDGNYSLRVPRLGSDELGVLTEDFNTMLARIEGQDAELRRARDELSMWLAAQNEDLRHESGERRRAQELNQLLMHAVQNSREMISIADPDNRLVFANRAFLDAYGRSEQELVGRHEILIDSPSNPDGLRRQITEETRSGGWQGELLNRRKDGSEFPISLSTSVVKDDQGQVVGLLGVARDISEQRERETRLRLQEAALVATVDAVVITDREGAIEWVNPAFTRLTGYTPEEAMGRNLSILKSEAHTSAFYPEMWESLLAGRVWYGELSNRRKDGSLYCADGQQRIAGVLASNEPPKLIPVIVFDIQDLSEEAQVFVHINEWRKSLQPIEKHKSKIVAGDEAALAVERAVSQSGYTIDTSVGSGPAHARTIQAVAGVNMIYNRIGEEGLIQTLGVIKDVWPDDPAALSTHILRGIGALIEEQGENYSRTRLVNALKKTTPATVLRKADELRFDFGGSKLSNVRRAFAALAGLKMPK